jgi:hypothetical protein
MTRPRIAFAPGTVGYLHRRLHRPGDTGHVAGMGLSYIGLATTFYVDNGKHLPLWKDLPHLTCWLLPGIIGVPLILRALLRTRRRNPRHPATAHILTEHSTATLSAHAPQPRAGPSEDRRARRQAPTASPGRRQARPPDPRALTLERGLTEQTPEATR